MTAKRQNRLAGSQSPYLLQHAANPVDWYPWGEEAFARARAENKPIFLSVGYATCHWCHVMERESFENEQVAKIMNEHFVCIKVDREERPDVDDTYMKFVQMLTRHGGWPMSVWLTPDGKPFFGGTYYPPERFTALLKQIAQMWSESRDALLEQADSFVDRLQKLAHTEPSNELLTRDIIDNGARYFGENYDARHGGFDQGSPKFPRSHVVSMLLRVAHRKQDAELLKKCEHTLRAMAAGGMYDQIHGGFHRYSVDERWLVPHFEKMLYDNALLARTYLEAYQYTRNDEYRRVAVDILEYVLREMTGEDGGFYSAQDADSEGVEGKFATWTRAEIVKALGDRDGALIADYFGATEEGNFEHGTNVLHVPVPREEFATRRGMPLEQFEATLRAARAKLFEIRSRRVPPLTDDKVLVGWNGLMIGTMALAAQVVGDEKYRRAARRSADLILTQLNRDGRLLRGARLGKPMGLGYLEDYALFLGGLVDLYEATFDADYLRNATRLAEKMIELFEDKANGGFFDSGSDNEKLITRGKDAYDGAVPSGNSMAALALVRLAELTGRSDFEKQAERTLRAFANHLRRFAPAYPVMLMALDHYLGPRRQVVIIGERADPATRDLLGAAWSAFVPNRVLAFAEPSQVSALSREIPLLAGRVAKDGKATAYVCEDRTCQLPATTVEELRKQLKQVADKFGR